MNRVKKNISIYEISFLIIEVIFLTFASFDSLRAQTSVDLETGYVFTGYNNIRIPGNEGTTFSMKTDLMPENTFFYRIRLGYTINSRHNLSLLYAPLKISAEGKKDQHIIFQGIGFPANTDLKGIYQFNSYRLTYRFDFVKNPGFEFGMGFTAKIRDAKIAISSAGSFSEKTNIGFVPIINFRLFWKMTDQLGLLLEGDALAAPQGRAEDVMIAATYEMTDHIRFGAGYRILEGGADNDEVYNFSLFHYATVSITYKFQN